MEEKTILKTLNGYVCVDEEQVKRIIFFKLGYTVQRIRFCSVQGTKSYSLWKQCWKAQVEGEGYDHRGNDEAWSAWWVWRTLAFELFLMVTWLKVWVRTHFAFKKVLVLKNKISEIRLFIKCVNTVAGFGVCMSPLPNLNIETVVWEPMAGGDLGTGGWEREFG